MRSVPTRRCTLERRRHGGPGDVGGRRRVHRSGPPGPAIARSLEDPAVLARTLTACDFLAGQGGNLELARGYLDEASARPRDRDRWGSSQILAHRRKPRPGRRPQTASAAGQEGRDLADAIGNGSTPVSAATLWEGHSLSRVIWPGLSHISTRWWPMPRRLTTRSGEGPASRVGASSSPTRDRWMRPERTPRRAWRSTRRLTGCRGKRAHGGGRGGAGRRGPCGGARDA